MSENDEIEELRAMVASLKNDLADADERAQVRACQWTSAKLRAEKAEAIVARLREPVSDADIEDASLAAYNEGDHDTYISDASVTGALNAYRQRILGENK